MAERGIKARRLSTQAGLNEPAVRDLLKSVTDPKLGTLLKLAKALNLSRHNLMSGMMPISGVIGAGGAIEMRKNGDLSEMVPIPTETDGVLIALKVEGDWLLPVYHSGDVIYCCKRPDKRPEDYIGAEVIAQLSKADGGATLLRHLHHGSAPERFDLRSFNSAEVPDVRLDWAAPVMIVIRKTYLGA